MAGCILRTTVAVYVLSHVASLAQEPTLHVMAQKLREPMGIAVRPDTNQIFVAESAAGRVIALNGSDPTAHDAIVGFPVSEVRGIGGQAGPLAIRFHSQNRLVVGSGGAPNQADRIGTYELPASDQPSSLQHDAAIASLGPVALDRLRPQPLVETIGDYAALAVNGRSIYALGYDAQGGTHILFGRFDSATGNQLALFHSYHDSQRTQTVAGLTISPEQHLVVGLNAKTGASLQFLNALTGRLLLNLETGLSELRDIAYSPKSGLLYAIAAEPGGLYRLDAVQRDRQQVIQPTRILRLHRPTAMAFSAEGSAFITAHAEDAAPPADNGAAATAQGIVVRVDGLASR